MGVAIAVVGAGLMVSLFFLPGTPTDTRSTSDSVANLGASSSLSWTIAEQSTMSGALVLSWSSSAPANVELSQAVGCPVGTGLCAVSPPIVSWHANLTGRWGVAGPVNATYLLSVTNIGHDNLSFSGTLVETYDVPTPSQAVPAWALITLGGLLLLGIGAIATFLGLFLPAGVYRPPGSGAEPPQEGTGEPADEPGPDSPSTGEP